MIRRVQFVITGLDDGFLMPRPLFRAKRDKRSRSRRAWRDSRALIQSLEATNVLAEGRLGAQGNSQPVERFAHLLGCQADFVNEVASTLSAARFLVVGAA